MSRFNSLVDHIRQHSKALGAKPRIGIDIPGLSKAFSIGKAFSSDTTTFTDEIGGIPSIQRSVPRLGGLGQLSSLSFAVTNQDLFSDLFASGGSPNPENEPVNVYLYYDDGTSILNAEREKLFSGIIDDFPTLDYSKVNFKVDSQDESFNKTIGTLLTDSDAADTEQGLPEEAQGKIAPIIYGDHIYLKGNNSKASDTVSNKNNMVPAVYLGVDSSGNHRWQISSHQVDQINAEGDDPEQQQIWGFDSTLNRYVRLSTTFTVEKNNSSGCIISHANNPYFYDYWYSKGDVVASVSGSGTTSNPTNVNDKDFTTSGELAGNTAGISGSLQRFAVPFSTYDDQSLSDTDISEIKVFVYAFATYLGVAGDGDHEVEIEGGSGYQNLLTQYIDDGGVFPDARNGIINGTNTLADIANTSIIKVTKQNSDANKGIEVDVYEMYKQIEYTRNARLPLFFAGKGREYGDWINGRSTVEGYTETHPDDDGEGTLIENGAGVIESLLFDELERNKNALNEPKFVTNLKWDITEDFDDSGGNAEYAFVAPGTSTLTQTAANRPNVRGVKGVGQTIYEFKYVCTVSLAPDNFALTITSAFAASAVTLPFTAGTHVVEFLSAVGAVSADFVISAVSTGTEGQIQLDNMFLHRKEINEDKFNIAATDLSTTVLSFAITEQIKDGDKLLDAILKTLGTVSFYDHDDAFSLRTFVATDGFGASAGDSPAAEDIWEFSPHTHFIIESGVNDVLRYKDSNNDIYNVTVTAGSYTGTGLATELETQMDAVSTPDMTVSYNASTGIFTIADAGGNYELLWSHGSTTIGEMLGFDPSATDAGAASYTSDFPVWQDSFVEHPIAKKGGFSLRKSSDPIVTDLTVNYYRSSTGEYQDISNVTDNTNHAEVIKKTIVNDYTRDATTVEFHRDFYLARSFKKFWYLIVKGMDANLSGLGVEEWDFINARHPLLNGIFGTGEETQKHLLLKEKLSLKDLSILVEAEEA